MTRLLSLPTRASTWTLRPLPSLGSCREATRHHSDSASSDLLVQNVLAYHKRTKHAINQYAKGPTSLDWANQPNPFRTYDGAEVTEMHIPVPDTNNTVTFSQLQCPQSVTSHPVNIESISHLLFYSLSISAWKKSGSSVWSLRVNPSSGNLHPTEAYVLAPSLGDPHKIPTLFHYQAKTHSLEKRAMFSQEALDPLISSLGHNQFVLVGLSSVMWREAWKYAMKVVVQTLITYSVLSCSSSSLYKLLGERAFRYCQHDIGHALAALRVSAASLGWNVSLIDSLSTERLDSILCLNRRDEFPPGQHEESEALLLLSPSIPPRFCVNPSLLNLLQPTSCFGTPNLLSKNSKDWAVIQAVARDTNKDVSTVRLEDETNIPQHSPRVGSRSPPLDLHSQQHNVQSLLGIVRRRRSALAFDPAKSDMPLDVFMSILLDGCVPSRTPGLYDFWGYHESGPLVHLLVFVHRVKDLEPGLYMLVRGLQGRSRALEEATESLKQAMPKFLWSPVEEETTGEQTDFGLYLLMEHNVQEAASIVSCLQDIAGDGSFSVGMLSNLPKSLKSHGAWMYRRLFWEAGIVGQSLYLHAEAHGYRGTGIGCYHDDDVHDAICSMDTSDFQSLYHFTIGTPIADPRIQDMEPYPQQNTGQQKQDSADTLHE